jgi:hypothetical protein
MFKSPISSKLDAEMMFLLEELEKHRDDPEKYAETVNRIALLEKLQPKKAEPLSMDVVVAVAANLFGILWIARYERENANVIKAPHAFRMIWKPKT